MIPFKRAFDEKRRMVVPLAAGLALNAILFVGVVYPLSARVRGTQQRAQAATRELADAEQQDKAARDLVRGKDRTDVALQAFYREVLPTSLAAARGMTYLHLAQLAEQHNLKSTHRNADADQNPQGALQRLRLSMSLEGNYSDVRKFVYDLESGSDFIVIDGVTLTEGGEPGSALQLTLALSTYYRHGS